MLTLEAAQSAREQCRIGIGLIRPADPDPRKYLEFAHEDISDGDGPRHRVNALANAKRALHLHVETFCDALGFERWTEKPKRPDFSVRVRFLAECGIATPRIVAKLNKFRNAVEHEYSVPSREETLDYVELVDLYLRASESLVRSFPHIREIKPEVDNAVYCLRTAVGSGVVDVYKCESLALLSAFPSSNQANGGERVIRENPISLQPERRVSVGDDASQFFRWAQILLGLVVRDLKV